MNKLKYLLNLIESPPGRFSFTRLVQTITYTVLIWSYIYLVMHDKFAIELAILMLSLPYGRQTWMQYLEYKKGNKKEDQS